MFCFDAIAQHAGVMVETKHKMCVSMRLLLFLHRKVELSDSSAVLEAFKFIENAEAEYSDEDDEEDSDGKDRTHVESRTVRKQSPHKQS